MGEGGERRRVGVVVGRHVDGLHGCDRVAPGRGDPFLELAHLVGQGGLVAHGRRHAPEQGRHLGAGLDEAEDVVDEQQHVLVADIAEVLGHGEGGQPDPQAHAGGLVHLPVDQSRPFDDAGLFHLQPEVVAFTGALADTTENRHTTVLFGHPVDQFQDQDRLAHAGASEEADLAALHVRLQQVDDLDAGLEHLGLRLQGVEIGRRAVDFPPVIDSRPEGRSRARRRPR